MEFVDIFSYKLPIAHLIDQLTNWLTTNCAGFFNLITKGGSALMDFITNGLLFLPPLLLIVLLTEDVPAIQPIFIVEPVLTNPTSQHLVLGTIPQGWCCICITDLSAPD